MIRIQSSEITPESVYLSRRKFMIGLGTLAGTTLLAPREFFPEQSPSALNKELTPFKSITSYNNFYEFSTDKESVAARSQALKTSPGAVKVRGVVEKPATFDVDDLRKKFAQEERIYRLRCVEAWSMVIPWSGFPLASLLKEVQPSPRAKYVR